MCSEANRGLLAAACESSESGGRDAPSPTTSALLDPGAGSSRVDLRGPAISCRPLRRRLSPRRGPPTGCSACRSFPRGRRTRRSRPSVLVIGYSTDHGRVHVAGSSTVKPYSSVLSSTRVNRSIRRMFSVEPRNGVLSVKLVVSTRKVLTLPATARIARELPNMRSNMRTAVQRNDPHVVDHLVQDGDDNPAPGRFARCCCSSSGSSAARS